MGHLIFIVLHLIACLFGFILLIITIPLHLIYANVRKSTEPGSIDNLIKFGDTERVGPKPLMKTRILHALLIIFGVLGFFGLMGLIGILLE